MLTCSRDILVAFSFLSCFATLTKMNSKISVLSVLLACVAAQTEPDWAKEGEIWYDTVKYGPEIELVHLYYDQFPTGKLAAFEICRRS